MAAEPGPWSPCMQASDAPPPMPDFDRYCRLPLQQPASRPHRVSFRPALDGIAGRDVVGRIQFVNAIQGHTRQRPAAVSVAKPLFPPVGAEALW
jgi:hypothetical protein